MHSIALCLAGFGRAAAMFGALGAEEKLIRIVTVGVMAVATATDLKTRRIPNWLVFPYLLTGIGVQCWFSGWRGLGQGLGGLALGGTVFGLMWLMGGMGAGDVKLCAGVGAWIGPAQMLIAMVLTGMAGGLIILVWATLGGFLGELGQGTRKMVLGWAKHGVSGDPEMTIANPKARKIPYAPAIAIGTLLSFFYSAKA